ncbi:MAG: hypothetical protein J6T96_05315 [Bacteroidales bacterium]|nr:hypothetical protein [Bacteroidales bacterium]
MTIKDRKIEELTGYKPISTFYTDFSIADNFGIDAVKDTYKTCFENWSSDYKMLTELVMALNWKIWEHFNAGNDGFAEVYNELWEKADAYAMDNLKDEELSYFLRTTD